MTNNRVARFAGIACMFGGLFFFLDFMLVGWAGKTQFLSPSNTSVYFMRMILWCLAHLGLMGGAFGLLALGVAGTSGWRKKLSVCGAIWTILGTVSYLFGTTLIYNFPDQATNQFFTPLGSLLMTIGMLILSGAVLSAGVWHGWRRFVPLLVGLYFPLQVPLQIIYFLEEGKGPNQFLLGAWGLFWALLGVAIWSSSWNLAPVVLGLKRA